MNTIANYVEMRNKLSLIAKKEGLLRLHGNENFAGEEIEKYLSTLREAMNKNGNYQKYSDLNVGYHWCGAFVYYCCKEAGFNIPEKPGTRYTFAAVKTWHEWSVINGFYYNSDEVKPSPGDIVIFDKIMSDLEMDHVGIIIEVQDNNLITSEGNFFNKSGTFTREINNQIKGYIRISHTF